MLQAAGCCWAAAAAGGTAGRWPAGWAAVQRRSALHAECAGQCMRHAGNSRRAARPIRQVGMLTVVTLFYTRSDSTPLRRLLSDSSSLPSLSTPKFRWQVAVTATVYTPSSDKTVIQCESHDSLETSRVPDIRLCVSVSCGQATTATSTSMQFRERQRC